MFQQFKQTALDIRDKSRRMADNNDSMARRTNRAKMLYMGILKGNVKVSHKVLNRHPKHSDVFVAYFPPSKGGENYRVLVYEDGRFECTCPDHDHKSERFPCKHVQATAGLLISDFGF